MVIDNFARDGYRYEIVDMGEVNDHGVRYLVDYRADIGYNGGGAGLRTIDDVRDYLKIRGIEWATQLMLDI